MFNKWKQIFVNLKQNIIEIKYEVYLSKFTTAHSGARKNSTLKKFDENWRVYYIYKLDEWLTSF